MRDAMDTANIALYAGGPLGPKAIGGYLRPTQQAGWTTIILGLFHIGNPKFGQQKLGDIIFNDPPAIISDGKYQADPSWPGNVAKLKQGSSITKIYASVGGGPPVVDFATIAKIYEDNGGSFSGTALEANFQVLRTQFPAIDGIDMDCEETYDQTSFVAFCRMLTAMGFSLTFCPYDQTSFWTGALSALEKVEPGVVKWWNLQCYDGGTGNDPGDWADAITKAIPGFSTDGYVVAGDWSRWYNTDIDSWEGDCPSSVTSLISSFSKEPALGGGFIWNMDAILKYGPDPAGCGQAESMADYVKAVANAMGSGLETSGAKRSAGSTPSP